MPAVTDVLLETILPAHMQRRVWAYPEVQSHALIVLTFARLYALLRTSTPTPEIIAAAETGPLPDLLGPDTVVIDLPTVHRAQLDLLTNSITLHVGGPANTKHLTLAFATPETADACFTKVWRRLGDECRLLPYKQNAWALARAPLVLLTAILLTTAALTLGLSIYEDTASDRAASSAEVLADKGDRSLQLPEMMIVDLLDWKWVCAAGGAGAALAQVWLYRRLTSPPVSLAIVRDEVLPRTVDS